MKFVKIAVLAVVGSVFAVSCCPNAAPAAAKNVYVKPSK